MADRARLAVLLLLVMSQAASGQEPAASPVEPASVVSEVSAAAREQQALVLKRVSEQLICQCGCSMILSECSHQNCPFALPQRKKIIEQIVAGRSDEEIIEGYVRDYGRTILSAPPAGGSLLDRSAWMAPGVALGAGLLVAIYFVRFFTRRAVVSGTASPVAMAGTRSDDSGGGGAAADTWLRRVEDELKAGPGGGQS